MRVFIIHFEKHLRDLGILATFQRITLQFLFKGQNVDVLYSAYSEMKNIDYFYSVL